MNFFKEILSVLLGVFIFNTAYSEEKQKIHMLLDKGLVVIETYPEKAPKTVQRIVELSNEGFYDGLTFHRVISGFMAQGGDPNGNGTGGSGQNIVAEFNDIKHERGIVSMARSNEINSADSQFFICFESAPHLDRQYSAFGKVIKGMEFVDMIKKGDSNSGSVIDPDKIISIRSK